MFLSTVRTRHLIDATNIQTDGQQECDDDKSDFGFLSDGKLLNTAFTRAQSLVVVVGDPVALCAVGECTNVWRLYLKHCQNMGSLYPPNHTLESIKQQVLELMNSPSKGKLLQAVNQRSQQSVPLAVQPVEQKPAMMDYRAAAINEPSISRVMQQVRPSSGSHAVRSADVEQQLGPVKLEVPLPFRNGSLQPSSLAAGPSPIRAPLSIPGRSIPPAPLRLPLQRKQETYFSVGDQFTVDAEEVLKQLAKLAKDGGKTVGAVGLKTNEEIQPELITVRVQNGHVVVDYGQGADMSIEASSIQYSKDQLEQLVRFNPGKYMPCRIKFEKDHVYAEVLDTRSQTSIITIEKKVDCGGAIYNDEAVVEVVTVGKEHVSGRVVGVLRRVVDLEKSIVCSVEAGDAGVFIPVNSDLPPLHNITPSALESNIDRNVSVYKFTTTKQIRFDHMESVKGCSEDKLFVVKFLKWDSSVQLHLCVVIGILPSGIDITTGMSILDIVHHVVYDHLPESNLEVEHTCHQAYQLDAEVYQSRVDLRTRWCFTIDNQLAEDTDNAFSIDEIGDGSYQIGVHVSDISYFVPKDSSVDTEARNRGLTMYHQGGEPAYMLPRRLSTELCSLKPDQDKVVVSVLMAVQPTGEVKQVSVQKSIINIKQKFTFQEADVVLQDPLAHEDYLKSCVLVLYEISRMWKKNRLGNASFCQYLQPEEKLSPLSHQLVSEMQIMMQYHVAQIILGKFPQVCPLYCQQPPSVNKLTVWKHEHAADAVNSMALTKPFLEGSATCKCKVACTCIGKFIRQSNLKVRDTIDVNSVIWDGLTQASDSGQFGFVQSLIVEAENHPQLAVAQHKLRSIENPSYSASSEDVIISKMHYSINLSPYTQCSKPNSRYMDLVVQRILVSCIDSSLCPYTMEEIQILCSKLKTVECQKKLFEEAVMSLHLGLALNARPLIVQPIVEAVTKEVIEVCFPYVSCMSKEQSSIPVNLLNPVSATELINGAVELKWQERIYSAPGFQSGIPSSNLGELNPDRFIYKIPAKDWQRLLMAVREEDVMMYQKLKAAVDFVGKKVINPATLGVFIDEVTSESKSLTGRLHRVSEFTLKVSPFQVLQVQLSSQIYHGLIAPVIQLVNITPNLDLCIEHHRHPERCFSDKSSASNISTNQKYTDLNTYLKCLEPAVNVEAAIRSVNEGNRIVIHGVTMIWRTEIAVYGNQRIAQFTLPLSYLKERWIKLLPGVQTSDLFDPSNSSLCQAFFADFVCVRYSNLGLPDDPTLNDEIAVIMNNGVPVKWVGHCIITSVKMDNNSLTFRMKLLQSSVPLPDVLSQSLGSQIPCTIELIERSCIDR